MDRMNKFFCAGSRPFEFVRYPVIPQERESRFCSRLLERIFREFNCDCGLKPNLEEVRAQGGVVFFTENIPL